VSSDVDEEAIPSVARLIGSNRMLWATDYPHIDAHKDPIPELREKIRSMPPEDQEWILGKAAAELYRL
jgi:predicted TIM-barrel fold metal-dependent hydrolase